jgi:hypothetical protein
MASGFFALLDDIAAIAKTAAASLDDVAVQAVKASKNAAGIVVDDAAVTPRYVTGFAASRELPIVAKIAWGSIKNKIVYLLPGALVLSYFAPWAITPLLMIGGAYLCFEGYEKLNGYLHPSAAPVSKAVEMPDGDPREIEDAKVASAIRTDFVLSAEIMAITLASMTMPDPVVKGLTLAAVAVLVTVAVYGAVAMIVKADDVGLYLAQKGRLGITRAIGRGLVSGMPPFLKVLSFIGMLAMLWVGGGIIVHGLAYYGLGLIAHTLHDWGAVAGAVTGPLKGFVTWLVEAASAGVVGVVVGWIVAQTVGRFVAH